MKQDKMKTGNTLNTDIHFYLFKLVSCKAQCHTNKSNYSISII